MHPKWAETAIIQNVVCDRRDPVTLGYSLAAAIFVEMALNAEQEEALHFVLAGPNLLFTGQASIGKSRLVTIILKDCEFRNLKVAVVCLSGIPCMVNCSGLASTVHSFYGIGTADMPANLVLEGQWPLSALYKAFETLM